jgi:hypothetical protein
LIDSRRERDDSSCQSKLLFDEHNIRCRRQWSTRTKWERERLSAFNFRRRHRQWWTYQCTTIRYSWWLNQSDTNYCWCMARRQIVDWCTSIHSRMYERDSDTVQINHHLTRIGCSHIDHSDCCTNWKSMHSRWSNPRLWIGLMAREYQYRPIPRTNDSGSTRDRTEMCDSEHVDSTSLHRQRQCECWTMPTGIRLDSPLESEIQSMPMWTGPVRKHWRWQRTRGREWISSERNVDIVDERLTLMEANEKENTPFISMKIVFTTRSSYFLVDCFRSNALLLFHFELISGNTWKSERQSMWKSFPESQYFEHKPSEIHCSDRNYSSKSIAIRVS